MKKILTILLATLLAVGTLGNLPGINPTSLTTVVPYTGATTDLDLGLHYFSGTYIVSTVAIGTAPVQVTSTTVCPNLNVSFLEGHAASYFAVAGGPFTGNLTGNVSGSSQTCVGNAGSATYASAATVADDTSTNATMYPLWVTANTGNLPLKLSSSKFSFNPSTGVVTATGFAGALTGNVTGNTSGSSGSCTGNAATATTATNATNSAVTDDTTTAATMYPVWVTANTGNLPLKLTSTKLSFNPSTGTLTSTAFAGNLTGDVTGNTSGSSGTCTGNAGSATYAAAATIADDTTTNATMYPVWVTANTGNLPPKVTSTKLSFNPSTGTLTSTAFAGALTGAASANPTISSGDGAPGTTPGKIGDIYVDTTGHKLYFSDGTTNSGDWVIAN